MGIVSWQTFSVRPPARARLPHRSRRSGLVFSCKRAACAVTPGGPGTVRLAVVPGQTDGGREMGNRVADDLAHLCVDARVHRPASGRRNHVRSLRKNQNWSAVAVCTGGDQAADARPAGGQAHSKRAACRSTPQKAGGVLSESFEAFRSTDCGHGAASSEDAR